MSIFVLYDSLVCLFLLVTSVCDSATAPFRETSFQECDFPETVLKSILVRVDVSTCGQALLRLWLG